jgi:hypothetical protein
MRIWLLKGTTKSGPDGAHSASIWTVVRGIGRIGGTFLAQDVL